MNEKRGRSRAYGPVLSIVIRLFLIIGIIGLSIACVIGIRILKSKETLNAKMSQEIVDLENDIKDEEDKKSELSKAKNRSVSDEEYESLAREELGFIKKDEIVIKPR